MASGNSKPLVSIPDLQLYIGGKVDGVTTKIGSKVDNSLKGKPVSVCVRVCVRVCGLAKDS